MMGSKIDKFQKMRRSLDGTSVGDAFGMRILLRPELLVSRTLPAATWRWSDDTHMTLSVVENLAMHGRIDQDSLIAAFARRYAEDPHRAYGLGVRKLLEQVGSRPWQELTTAVFANGSWGNGAAMRATPIGAYFSDDLSCAAAEAILSATVTHAHPEGQAGAAAVAVAAALAAQPAPPVGREFLEAACPYVPAGAVLDGIEKALHIAPEEHAQAVAVLGTGRQISAQDTVPYCLWCAAHHLDNFEEALWTTIAGLEDGDTTCAIVGGIVALAAPIPAEWLAAREALVGLEEWVAGRLITG